MIEVKGKYNTAIIYSDNIDSGVIEQVQNVLNKKFSAGSKIRIMPDTHVGKGSVIGTTMTITDKVVPNLVGVDIGCGVDTAKLAEKEVNLVRLDKIIHDHIPAGFKIRRDAHPYIKEINLSELRIKKAVDIKRAILSLGSLGGGNHFIELNKDEEGNLYLVVHSGSRNLGKQTAEFYQKEANKYVNQKSHTLKTEIAGLKGENKIAEASEKEEELELYNVEKSLAFFEGQLFEDYIHDMEIVQRYALLNRKAIIEEIIEKMEFTAIDSFTTIHNYIDTETMILRKGAISAQKDERILIPLNMRDGSLICKGKGNPDWNYSAPHGAGRLMSRTEAKSTINLDTYKKSMEGIYTTTVGKSTIDEAPFAYKPKEEILDNITDTAELLHIIKPVYNFKA